MIKKFLFIMAVLITVLVISAGAYVAYGEGNPPPPPSPAPRTPTPPESIPPEARAAEYYFVDKEHVLGLGMQLPRVLKSQENDAVTQVGLNIKPVSGKINQGYDSKPIWMSYNKNSGWGYINQIDKVIQAKPETTYFPGVRVGLGTPQQEEIDVAVDLNTQTAVYAIRRPDKRVIAPSYIQYFTEEQKAKMNAIASQTEAVQNCISGERQVDYQFVAISATGGIAFSMEYDIVRKGIPADQYKEIEDKSMKIYPAVVFKSDSWMVSTAVDLKTDKVMYTYTHPTRQGF